MSKDPLLNQIADDQIYDLQRRLLQHPGVSAGAVSITGPEILLGVNWGQVKASAVRRMKREQAAIGREMDREINGLPGLFEAIEEVIP